MDRDPIGKDTGAAAGLIIGIILGSLALNLYGASRPSAPQVADAQAVPRARGIAPGTAAGSISQR